MDALSTKEYEDAKAVALKDFKCSRSCWNSFVSTPAAKNQFHHISQLVRTLWLVNLAAVSSCTASYNLKLTLLPNCFVIFRQVKV